MAEYTGEVITAKPYEGEVIPIDQARPELRMPSWQGFKDQLTSRTLAEHAAGSTLGRGAIGAYKGLLAGPAKFGANVGDYIAEKLGLEPSVGREIADHLDKIEATKKRGMSPGEYDIAGTVGQAVPYAGINMAASLPMKIAQGAGIGSFAGATSGDKGTVGDDLTRAAVGGAIGAGVPAVQSVAGPIMRTIGALFRSPDKLKEDALLSAAGPQANQISALLRQNKQFVPGSQPTAGEAAAIANNPNFSALQASASKVPEATGAYAAREAEQNAARLAQVRSVGQTPTILEAAKSARSVAAQRNYGDAFNVAIKADPNLLAISQNPYFKEALPDAIRLADAKGISAKTDLTEFLHYVKLSLDKQLSKSGDTALSSTEKQAVQGVKEQLMNWMSGPAKNTLYGKARLEFANASKPINQMEVGQYLESKLTNPLDETARQRSAGYSQALRDAPRTIQSAIGGPRYDDLTKVLTPQQLTAVESVRDDLARGVKFETLARKGSADVSNIASEAVQEPLGGKIPAFLQRSLMVMHTIIDRSSGNIDKKVAANLALEMLNPPAVAESIAKAQARAASNKALAEQLSKMKLPVTAAAAQSIKSEY